MVAELLSLRSRIDAQVAGLVADADRADDAASMGATNTAAWLRAASGLTATEAARLVKRARALESHPETVAGLATGQIHTAQAEVIVTAVDGLPDEVADQRQLAEAHLLALAAEYDAKALRALGGHLLEVVAPDQADALLARQLEAEEAEARRTAYLTTWSDGPGSRCGRFKLPETVACMLDAQLEALVNPARPDPLPRQGRDTAQVRGLALAELIERYPAQALPMSGGVSAQVVVTMTLGTLLGGLEAATIVGTDHRLSPGDARRLAAAAGVIPAVLGSESQPLDLGRHRRLFTRAQRLALSLRQQGLCNISGCERPATWADANHRKPWSQTGPTDLANGELICPRHHTLVHQGHHYPRRT